MNFRIKTKFDEMCLAVTVAVKTPVKVRIKIYDSEKENIIFTDRYKHKNLIHSYIYYSNDSVSTCSAIVATHYPSG